jgi:hypothetical protein
MMPDTTTIIIIIVILLLVFYFLFYPSIKESFSGSGSSGSDLNTQKLLQQQAMLIQQLQMQNTMGPSPGQGQPMYPGMQPGMYPGMPQPNQDINQPININVATGDEDPFADSIKRTDLYTIYDPLTFPQQRMSREVLDMYKAYYEKNGSYPPFNLATQGYLFDNPIQVGYLVRTDNNRGNDDFDGSPNRRGRSGSPDCDGERGTCRNDNNVVFQEAPYTIPLFRVKSAKNTNRYYYYTIDQKYFGKFQTKIPFVKVVLNGKFYNNADEYGIDEVFDHDTMEIKNIYPGIIYRATIYRQNHFP